MGEWGEAEFIHHFSLVMVSFHLSLGISDYWLLVTTVRLKVE